MKALNAKIITTNEAVVKMIATRPTILAPGFFCFKYLNAGLKPKGGRKKLNK